MIQHYSLICILLEAGGCSIPLSGKRGPDPLYVNRARATILHLDSLSVPGGIEEHLSKPAVCFLLCFGTLNWNFIIKRDVQTSRSDESVTVI